MFKILFGVNIILRLIKYSPYRILRIITIKSFVLKKIINVLINYKINLKITNKRFFDFFLKKYKHQYILAYIVKNKVLNMKYLPNIILKHKTCFICILECINNSNNLGAFLRNALAFNVSSVMITKNKCLSFSYNINKISCLASEFVTLVFFNNIMSLIRKLKFYDFYIIGTSLSCNKNLKDIDLTSKRIALIFGSEELGISYKTSRNCHILIKIPISKYSNSLNLSVSSGIILHHIYNTYF